MKKVLKNWIEIHDLLKQEKERRVTVFKIVFFPGIPGIKWGCVLYKTTSRYFIHHIDRILHCRWFSLSISGLKTLM